MTKGGRERGREGEREGGREGRREGGREGGRKIGRKYMYIHAYMYMYLVIDTAHAKTDEELQLLDGLTFGWLVFFCDPWMTVDIIKPIE